MPTEEEGFGSLARRWLHAKKDALLAGTAATQRQTATEADNLEKDLKDRIASAATFAAVPQLRRWKERQDASAAERSAQERTAVLALPRAAVSLTAAGSPWSGELPVRVEHDPEDAELRIELVVLDDLAPLVGGLPLLGLTLLVPGFHGDGRYDLAEVGADADFADWCLCLGNRDEPFYWTPDTGPGAVTVTGRRVEAQLTMSGASGELELRAHIGLP